MKLKLYLLYSIGTLERTWQVLNAAQYYRWCREDAKSSEWGYFVCSGHYIAISFQGGKNSALYDLGPTTLPLHFKQQAFLEKKSSGSDVSQVSHKSWRYNIFFSIQDLWNGLVTIAQQPDQSAGQTSILCGDVWSLDSSSSTTVQANVLLITLSWAECEPTLAY